MNKKQVILLVGTALAVSGAIFKGTQTANANLVETDSIKASHTSISPEFKNVDIIAQYGDSPWNQRIAPQTYKNPDTGQELCFYYASSRWAPCPGQGDNIIIPQGAKCRGGDSMQDVMNRCPAAKCLLDQTRDQFNGTTNTPPCNGLP